MRKDLRHSLAALLLFPLPALAFSPLTNDEMREETGQGLLVAETIAGTGASTGYTFTRMGLDANLYLNANIDKFQLGCGGFNESVLGNSCDIDMDYVRLMGRYPNGGDNPNQIARNGNSRAGDPATSDFLLKRPYIEIATKGTGVNQELVGIKISAQETTGFFGVGRTYASGATNLENGGVCGTSEAARYNCHSGINSLSGSLNIYVSAYVRFTTGLGDGAACIGEPAGYSACAGSPDGPLWAAPTLSGTRINGAFWQSVPLRNMHGASGLLSLLQGNDLYAQMGARLREVHGFELNGTRDFSISFQRERLAYPNYDKTTYGVAGNAGWWMNVPRVELRDLEPATVDLGCPGLFCAGLLSAFNPPGIYAGYPDLRSKPPANCYGTTMFC